MGRDISTIAYFHSSLWGVRRLRKELWICFWDISHQIVANVFVYPNATFIRTRTLTFRFLINLLHHCSLIFYEVGRVNIETQSWKWWPGWLLQYLTTAVVPVVQSEREWQWGGCCENWFRFTLFNLLCNLFFADNGKVIEIV
jgi:hypothetical protein